MSLIHEKAGQQQNEQSSPAELKKLTENQNQEFTSAIKSYDLLTIWMLCKFRSDMKTKQAVERGQ